MRIDFIQTVRTVKSNVVLPANKCTLNLCILKTYFSHRHQSPVVEIYFYFSNYLRQNKLKRSKIALLHGTDLLLVGNS